MGEMWTCPDCKEQFVTRNQWHSCQRQNVDLHFDGRPDWQVLVFDEMCRLFDTLGTYRIRSVPSALIFKKKSGYASLKLQKSSVHVDWITDHLIDDERVLKTLQMSRNRIVHTVSLGSYDELDGSLRDYLKEAYTVATDFD